MLEAESSTDVCSDNIFLTDYENCLQCSAEDKEDVWKYYGAAMTSAAAACGLSTTPYTGSTTSTIQSALAATATSAASASATTAASNGTAVTTASAGSSASGTVSAAPRHPTRGC